MRDPKWRRLSGSAIAGATPLIVLLVTLGGLMLALGTSLALYLTYTVLFVGTVGLIASGETLTRRFFRVVGRWPFLASTALICAGWAWQRYVFISRVPNQSLDYGYFLKPEAARLRFILVEAPFTAVTVGLGAIASLAVFIALRRGAGFSVVWLVIWTVVAFIVFGVPTFYLSIQGDASVFI
jgi:hypothetical protein